jgi:hypothetical protein
MKSKDIERLKEDFVKYCNQIGIMQRPKLILRREEMHQIQVSAGERKGCASWGECFWHLNTIFIDTAIRVHYPRRIYKGHTRPARSTIKHKSKYIDFLYTLVHELVHYRFPKYRHGHRFEKRVQEILQGQTFEPIEQQQQQQKEPKKEYDGSLDYFLVYCG